MRRLLPLIVALSCVALSLAACGGGDDEGGSSDDPRAAALSFVPPDAPMAIIVDTDLDGPQARQVDALLGRLPAGKLVIDALKDQFIDEGTDFERDVRPLLGNDAVVAAPDKASFDADEFIGAIVAKNSDAVKKLVQREGGREAGGHRGFELYRDDDGDITAVDGDKILFGDELADVRAAIDRSEGGEGLKPAAVTEGLGSLPKDGLIEVVGDAGPLLAGRESATARRIPWIASLGRFALTGRARESGLDVGLRIDTSKGDLTDADIPLAGGDEAPGVAGELPIRVGLRDAEHVLEFAQRAAQAADPDAFRGFALAKRQIVQGARVDVDRDVIGQLGGNVVVVSDGSREVLVHAALEDGAAMAQTLQRLFPLMGAFFQGAGLEGATVRRRGEDLYVVERNGRGIGAYGVIGEELVAGTGSPARLRELARAERTPVPGAKGALAFRLDGRELAALIADAVGAPAIVRSFLGPIGEVTGSVRATTKELVATATLAVGG